MSPTELMLAHVRWLLYHAPEFWPGGRPTPAQSRLLGRLRRLEHYLTWRTCR